MELIKRLTARLSILCCVAGVYIFLYVPIILVILFSFKSATGHYSLEWYRQLWQSSYIWQAFGHSLIVACAATALSISMSLGLIYYYSLYDHAATLFTFFYGTIVIPEVVLAVGLLSLFAFLQVPLGLVSLTVAHTVLALGYVVPLVYNRFKSLDPRTLEAAYDLGATPRQAFFTITLPLLAPALMASGLLVFILSFDDFILSFFCAGSEAQTLSLYIFSMLRSGTTPVLNALSTVLLGLSSVLVLVFCWLNVKTRIF